MLGLEFVSIGDHVLAGRQTDDRRAVEMVDSAGVASGGGDEELGGSGDKGSTTLGHHGHDSVGLYRSASLSVSFFFFFFEWGGQHRSLADGESVGR